GDHGDARCARAAERREFHLGRDGEVGGCGVRGDARARRARAELSRGGRQDGAASSRDDRNAGGERRDDRGARGGVRVRRAWVAACALGLAASGCGAAGGQVTRIVDGRTVEGRFVGPEAYGSFLRGAIAEAHGALDEAAQSYEAVAKIDDSDPEVFSRIARVRCARDPHDGRAKEALARAFDLDPDYGPAWEAAAACGRGDVG